MLGIAQDGGVPHAGCRQTALRRGAPRSPPAPSRRRARPPRPGRRQALPDRRDSRLRRPDGGARRPSRRNPPDARAHRPLPRPRSARPRGPRSKKRTRLLHAVDGRASCGEPALEPPRRAREHRDPRDRAGRRARAHARPPRHRHPRPAPRRGLRHGRVPRARPGPQAPLAARHRQVGEVGPPARGLSRRPDAHGVRRRHLLLRRRAPRPLDRRRPASRSFPRPWRSSRRARRRRGRVVFVHLNHTNRLLWDAAAVREVEARGFSVAREGQTGALSSGGE